MKPMTMPRNEAGLAWQKFLKDRMAVTALWILGVFYAAALLADVLAPYSLRDESRAHTYCPPTGLHFFTPSGQWAGLHVRGVAMSYDIFRRRMYHETAAIYPVKFFSGGESYRLLGVVPFDRHFFTVDAPGRIYLLGADSRGRDIFSRIIHGARVSLTIGLLGVFISFGVGLLVGGIAGYCGGRTDQALMRVCEMVMMVPGFYLLLALRAAVPDSLDSLQVYAAIVIILSFIGWAGLARVIRGMCLSLKARDYVLAAKTMGLSDLAIIMRHILPHTISYSLAAVTLAVPGYILGESALSLIGLGIQDPYASWGNMLAEAMSIVRIQFAPWILWPAFFIGMTVLCFNLVGDALRDAWDPWLNGKGGGA
ncbi:MAG: ABC transporter permease [Candidatus Omnitrophota bacterium]